MKKLQFKTNSRHISQLGRELVTDFVTALVELIKNSYDADAYGVKIILDKPNTPQSRIVLIDTGTGMTQSDFENKWMVIGTNNKITEPYTPKGRKKAGKKGIGRFSVERLAEKVQIYSFPEFEPPYRVDINWNSFEEINIPALTQRIGILKDHQESTAAKFICNQLEYFMVTDKILQEDKDTVEQELDKLPKDEMFEKAEEYLNDKGIENSLVFEEYNIDFKMKFNGSTYYCELLVDNSLEEKTEYRKNISVEKLTTWFEKLNSNFGILFYYPRINRMYFYPVSNNMTLPEITDGKKIRQIKINDKCLL